MGMSYQKGKLRLMIDKPFGKQPGLLERLEEALIANANIAYSYCLKERSAALALGETFKISEYEALFLKLAPNIPNVVNVLQNMLGSADDDRVILALRASAAILQVQDAPLIRKLLISKIGQYSPEIDAELIKALIQDTDAGNLAVDLDKVWDHYSLNQRTTIVSILARLDNERARGLLKDIEALGDPVLSAVIADNRTSGPKLSDPYRYFLSLRQKWEETMVVVRREFEGAGIKLPDSKPIDMPLPVPTNVEGVIRQLSTPYPGSSQAQPAERNEFRSFYEGGSFERADLAQRVERAAPSSPSSSDAEQEDEAAREGATMSLFEHLDELRQRIFKACVAIIMYLILSLIIQDKVAAYLIGSTNGSGNSFLEINALTISSFLAIILAFPIVMYQVLMYIAPGLTRRERRIVLTFLPPVIVSIIIVFSIACLLSLALIRPLPITLNLQVYLLEKFVFILFPVLFAIMASIIAGKLIIRFFRNKPQIMDGFVLLTILITGSSLANIIVGKRNAQAMQHRIIMNFASAVGNITIVRKNKEYQDLKRYFFGSKIAIFQVAKWFIYALIPFTFLLLPLWLLIVIGLILMQPRRVTSWAYVLGQYISKIRTTITEWKDKELSALERKMMLDGWKLFKFVRLTQRFLFVPAFSLLWVFSFILHLPLYREARVELQYLDLALWVSIALLLTLYAQVILTVRETLVIVFGTALFCMVYAFLMNITNNLHLSLDVQLRLVQLLWSLLAGFLATIVLLRFANNLFFLFLLCLVVIPLAFFPTWLSTAIILSVLLRYSRQAEAFIRQNFSWLESY